jgi:hypothetical protein
LPRSRGASGSTPTSASESLALFAWTFAPSLSRRATATQKKIDLFQKLSDGNRISIGYRIHAKRTLGEINEELEEAMGKTLSPEQMAAYKKATSKK